MVKCDTAEGEGMVGIRESDDPECSDLTLELRLPGGDLDLTLSPTEFLRFATEALDCIVTEAR